MKQLNEWINALPENKTKDILWKILKECEDMDADDFFGTEGWRHYFNMVGVVPDWR